MPEQQGETDLRALLVAEGSEQVTVSVPALPVLITEGAAEELASAVRAALANVRRHCGERVRAWCWWRTNRAWCAWLTAAARPDVVVLDLQLPDTVQNHVQNTLSKLDLHNRVELVRYAIEHGLADDTRQ